MGCLAKELGITQSALRAFSKFSNSSMCPLKIWTAHYAKLPSYKELYAQLQRFTSEDPEVIGAYQQARQALEAGDFAQVETLLHQAQARDLQAIQAQQTSLKQRQLSAAATSAELGALKNIQLSYAASATQYRQAARLVPQDEALTQAAYLNAEGSAWIAAGQYAEAQPPLEYALALREKGLGPEHPDVAVSLNNLAEIYRAQGRYADAEPLHKRALALREKGLGPEHPQVAQSLNNLAILYYGQGRYADAEPHLKRALAILVKALGPEHPDIALSLNNLADLYYTQGRYADAEPLYQRALALREKALGPEHPDVAVNLSSLAELYRAQGRYADAESHFQRALAISEKARPGASPSGHEPQQSGQSLLWPGPVCRCGATLQASAGHLGEETRSRAS